MHLLASGTSDLSFFFFFSKQNWTKTTTIISLAIGVKRNLLYASGCGRQAPSKGSSETAALEQLSCKLSSSSDLTSLFHSWARKFQKEDWNIMTVYSGRCNPARGMFSRIMGSRRPRSSPCFWPCLFLHQGFLGTQHGLFVIITWHREAALPTPQNAAATQGCRQGQCTASCFQLETRTRIFNQGKLWGVWEFWPKSWGNQPERF